LRVVCLPQRALETPRPARIVPLRAFSGEVDTGSPLENAIKQ
jgi:hypothetical protein